MSKRQRYPLFILAATIAGVHIRLWKCQQESSTGYVLMPFWGQNHLGDYQEYKDIGNEEGAQLVLECFDDMKKWPPSAHAGQTDDTSYQPVHASSYSAIDDSVEGTAPHGYQVEASGSYATGRHDEPIDTRSFSAQFQYGNQGAISWNQYTNPPSTELDLMDNGQASYSN